MAQLGFLPPGARGYLAGEQSEYQRQNQGMGQLQGLLQMQGALMQQEQMRQSLMREQGFRNELGKLGPNPDPQQAANLAMRFGKPEIAFQLFNQLEQRKSRETIAEENRIAQGQRTDEMNRLRGDISRAGIESREDIAARDRALRGEIAAGRPAPAPTMITVQDPSSPTGWSHRDARGGAVIPGAPAPTSTTRPAPFESELQRQTAKDYTKIVEDSQRMGDQLDLTKKAINQFRDYTQSELLGTGAIATLGGATKYISSKTEALEAVFRTINLKNMVATFSGMTRAIDTDAERRAWEATQPGVSLDDPTNTQILVGGLSLAAKTQAEGAARKRYIEASPDKTLKGYVSPVIGRTSVLFNAEGDPVVIPKEQINQFRAQGLMTDEEYGKQILGKSRRRTDKPQEGWGIREIK